MKNFLGGSSKENRTALAVGALGGFLLALSWLTTPANFTFWQWGLALALIGSLVLADRFPIHLRYAVKISLISVPLFLIMALLPLPLALLATGAAVLCADLLARRMQGLLVLDLIQDPARWMMIVYVSNAVEHLNDYFAVDGSLLLVAAAACMFVLDVLTFSLFTSFNIREAFFGLVRDGFVQSFEIESIQYLIAILGALAFRQVAWALLLLVVPIVVCYHTFKNAKEMSQSTREMLVNMADTVDLRDAYTGGHAQRVAKLACLILDQMGITGNEYDLINTAARLHDIGKIGIPDAILLKPEPLTPAEWQVMRSHPQKGAELLGRYADFARGQGIVLYHHERADGSGYPRGLKGSEIPFGARVIAVADAFDAMTTKRPYREGKTPHEAAQLLAEGRGAQWGAAEVDALLAALKEEPVDFPISQEISKSEPLPIFERA